MKSRAQKIKQELMVLLVCWKYQWHGWTIVQFSQEDYYFSKCDVICYHIFEKNECLFLMLLLWTNFLSWYRDDSQKRQTFYLCFFNCHCFLFVSFFSHKQSHFFTLIKFKVEVLLSSLYSSSIVQISQYALQRGKGYTYKQL